MTQEALLEQMESVDSDYAKRYSHLLAQQPELAEIGIPRRSINLQKERKHEGAPIPFIQS